VNCAVTNADMTKGDETASCRSITGLRVEFWQSRRKLIYVPQRGVREAPTALCGRELIGIKEAQIISAAACDASVERRRLSPFSLEIGMILSAYLKMISRELSVDTHQNLFLMRMLASSAGFICIACDIDGCIGWAGRGSAHTGSIPSLPLVCAKLQARA
jgi:hypothetical protein